MRTSALRCVNGSWTTVHAADITDKKPGEWFRDFADPDLFLRFHSGPSITPHFEIEPRWNVIVDEQ